MAFYAWIFVSRWYRNHYRLAWMMRQWFIALCKLVGGPWLSKALLQSINSYLITIGWHNSRNFNLTVTNVFWRFIDEEGQLYFRVFCPFLHFSRKFDTIFAGWLINYFAYPREPSLLTIKFYLTVYPPSVNYKYLNQQLYHPMAKIILFVSFDFRCKCKEFVKISHLFHESV